jgi:hypothetical protein
MRSAYSLNECACCVGLRAAKGASSAQEEQRRRPASDARSPEESRFGGTASSFVRSRRTRDGGPANKRRTSITCVTNGLETDEVIAEQLQRAMMNFGKMTKLRSIARARRVSLSRADLAVPHVAPDKQKGRKPRERREGRKAAEDTCKDKGFIRASPLRVRPLTGLSDCAARYP